MKTVDRAFWLPLAAIALALIFGLGYFSLRSSHAGDDDYEQHVADLRTLKQLDAETELDVLRLRTGLADNYDVLTESMGRTSALVDQACSRLEAERHAESVAISRHCTVLRDGLIRKAGLIEHFKSDHSILRNSLAFLPTAAAETMEALKDAHPSRSHGVEPASLRRAHAFVDDLLLANLAFAQRASKDQAVEMYESIDALEHVAAGFSKPVMERAAIFTLHARTVLQEQLVVDELLGAIQSLKLGESVDAIGNLLLAEQQRAGMRVERDRLALAVLSVVLVALLAAAAARLFRNFAVIRRSNAQLREYGQGLEVMVADRVADLRESEARMTHLARYDALTGLPNRHLFQDRLREAIDRADREGRHMALMFVDLDHFKQINDSLGHAVGDAVLRAVAVRLRDTMRDTDTVARLGGDEFTIVCEDLPDIASAVQVASKVREALSESLVVDGRAFGVSASVGVAIHAPGADDRDHLLRSADIAMYRAKDSGRNAFAVFEPGMATAVTRRAAMESHLRLALERDEFRLVFQPKVEIASGRITGVEALLRWDCPELGFVSPAEFIPLAEEIGLIVAIGEWVLDAACAQGAAWIRDGLPSLSIAVNLSPRELRDPLLIDRIARVLQRSGLPAHLLELELTEGVVMDDIDRNIETLKAIRALGARLAIDDFGTGYSSLAYLSRLPIQTLKVDRALITPMEYSANAATLVSTVVSLAHALELDVVAEGVETIVQRNLLAGMHCDQLQGYLFSKPIDADALAGMVRQSVAAATDLAVA